MKNSKRLTERYITEDGKYSTITLKEGGIQEAICKLAKYEDAEEAGTLVRLPCKVGAFVWVIKDYPFGKRKIEGVEIVGFIWPTIDSKPWPADRFGDAYSEVFHKYEDAKKRLKELQNED